MIEIVVKCMSFVIVDNISDLLIAKESKNVQYCIDLYICRIMEIQYIFIMLNNEFVYLGYFRMSESHTEIADLLNNCAQKAVKIYELIESYDRKIVFSPIVGNLSIIGYKCAKIAIIFSNDCKVFIELNTSAIINIYTQFDSKDLRFIPYIDFCKTIDLTIESAKEMYLQLDKSSLFHKLFK